MIHKNIVPNFSIRLSKPSDIPLMVSLSRAKRLLYEKAQTQFWRYAGEVCDKIQEEWFKELLENKNYVMFTAESNAFKYPQKSSMDIKVCTEIESNAQEILGFIIGRIMPAPEVYNP